MKQQTRIRWVIALSVMLAALLGVGIWRYVSHPAFSHADYVYGRGMVIDNETPFEYDDALAVSDGVGSVGLQFDPSLPSSTWAQVRHRYGNKILRQKDERLYTVYSAGGNRILYLFFEQNEDGEWTLCKEGLYDTVHSSARFNVGNLVYEQDSPQAILGDRKPTQELIGALDAVNYAVYVEEALRLLRQDTGIPHIRSLMQDGEIREAYRMTVEDHAHYRTLVVDFYVFANGTGTLKYRGYDTASGIIPHEAEPISHALTEEETASLLAVWRGQDFYHLSTPHPCESTATTEGYAIHLEGVEYHDAPHYDFSVYRSVSLYDRSMGDAAVLAIHDAMIAQIGAS